MKVESDALLTTYDKQLINSLNPVQKVCSLQEKEIQYKMKKKNSDYMNPPHHARLMIKQYSSKTLSNI